MTQPLNPTLFALLQARHGSVLIANAGERAVGVRTSRSAVTGRARTDAARWGEYYRINCPYCHDTRHRLWVSYLLGADLGEARPAGWLAICYNDECLRQPGRRQDFLDELLQQSPAARRKLQAPAQLADADEIELLKETTLPGQVVPLPALPAEHPARRYLSERGFNCDELSRVYGVGYCTAAPALYPVAQDRIIIPIRLGGVLVGWQARFVGEPPSKRIAKYYGMPGMPKRLLLYNYDLAQSQRLMVVVEGVTDVWRIGRPAVATLGKTLPLRQRQLLADWAAMHGDACVLVLCPDADDPKALAAAPHLAQELRLSLRCPVVELTLPTGYDPGQLDRGFFWSHLRATLRRHELELERYYRDD